MFTAEELQRIPLILPRRPHATCAMLDRAGISPARVVEADTLVEIMQHVLDRDGVTLLSVAGAAPDLAAGRVRAVRIQRPGLRRAIVLGYATASPLPDAAKSVVPLIRAEMANLAQRGAYEAIVIGGSA